MSPNSKQTIQVDEAALATRVRQAVAGIARDAETLSLTVQQLQQSMIDIDGTSSERQLRMAAVAGRAIVAQLALLTLDVSVALGVLKAMADVHAIADEVVSE
jgi:hypothetical protein